MENIVLQDERKEQIKIVDFGLSNIYTSNDPLRTHCGSPEYAAPELFVVGKQYGPEVDLWSLGVVLYGMVVGRLPFLCPRNEWTSSEERRRKLMIQINRGLTSIQEKAMCQTSSECKNLINRLLVPSARDRITIQKILDHPFLASKNNLYLCSEDDLNVSNHLAIVNEIAKAMQTTASVIEVKLIKQKYGEIAGMYNIKAHKLHQTIATQQLTPQLLRNSNTCKTENVPLSTMTVRTVKDNFPDDVSRNSNNTNCIIIMRNGQVQEQSIKKSSLHDSMIWRCHSGNGNYSFKGWRNSKICYDTSTMNTSLLPQSRASQIIKNKSAKISEQRLYRDEMQSKNSTSYSNLKKMEKNNGFSRNCKGNHKMISSASILQTYSRDTKSIPTSQVKDSFHKKILISPWQCQIGSARLKKNT